MGCLAGTKRAVRKIRQEITPEVMKDAGRLAEGFSARIADGKMSKEDAAATGADVVQLLHRTGRTAAEIAIRLAHQAVNKIGVPAVELGQDDQASEPEAL